MTDTNKAKIRAAYESIPYTRTLSEVLAELEDVRAKYFELLYAVSNKYEGESRHATALRYIQEHEQQAPMVGTADTADSNPAAREGV